MWKQLLLVGIGGGAGSILRFLFYLIIFKFRISVCGFPISTFIINIAGCFLLGILSGFLLKNNNSYAYTKDLLITGFCGGFTTFSAFSMENWELFQSESYQWLCLYSTISVIVGFIAVWIGMAIIK